MKTATQKQVNIIARYTLKRNGHVIYAVKSSNGVDQYQVLVINGAVESCSCPSQAGHCYHRRGVQIAEENRREQQVATPAATLAGYDVIGESLRVVNQAVNDAKIGDAYEVLAPTKKLISSVCGHLVKRDIHRHCGCMA